MRRRAASCLIALLPLLAASSCALARAAPRNPVEEFVDVLEQKRHEIGCSHPLIWDRSIEAVARKHNAEMMLTGEVSHVGKDGSDVRSRLEKGGVYFYLASENLAAGPTNGKRAFRLWYNSPGHRANMLNCRYTHHAVVYEQGYWTHVLVRYTL